MSPAPTAPLRCTVVTPYATIGGQEHWLLGLLDHGSRLETDVVLMEDGPLADLLRGRGIPVRVLDTGRDLVSLAAAVAALTRSFRRSPADVVVANGVKAGLVAAPAGWATGLPVVWVKHDFSYDGVLTRAVGRMVTRVVATSAAVGADAGRDDTELIPPPRPSDPVTDREAATRFWADLGIGLGTSPVVAVVGRLVGYKGVDTVIASLAQTAASAWRLVVVGGSNPAEPDEPDRLRALARALGVGDRVTFAGEVPDAGRWLAAFDAVAVTTRVDSLGYGREGYSMVALEALSAGVPLIGAQGNPEVVRMASAAGVVVPPDDPIAVAGALAEVADPVKRARLHAAAERLIAAHPDAQSCADRMSQLLAETAGRPGAGLIGPPLSVLTCLRNEQGHVAGVLGGVLAQLAEADEYLVLDDRSTDDTSAEITAWAARDPRVRTLEGPGVNLAAARNVGFGAARHDRVVCTDAGCEPGPGWLAAVRSAFAEPVPPDLVVGVYSVPGGDLVRDAFSLAAFPRVEEARRATPLVRAFCAVFGRGFDRHRLDGRSMGVSVSAWRSVGGFDESLFSSEDAAFGHRLLAAGHRSVLALDAEVEWAQGTLPETLRMYRKYGEWSARGGDWPLVARDLARIIAYAAAPVVTLVGGPATRSVLALGAAAYLSLPVARAVRAGSRPSVILAIPAALAAKDLTKAIGCLRGLASRRSLPPVAQRSTP